MAVLLVDNYDSFTHNLAQLVEVITGQAPIVIRNDALSVEEAVALGPEAVIVSPGPGRPDRAGDVGITPALVQRLTATPILGVCLGHQVLGVGSGGRVVSAPEPMHGRLSSVRHDRRGLFEGLPSPLRVVRYHSLVLERSSLPSQILVTAETDDRLVMAIAHAFRPHFGVQFHPESILSDGGYQLIANFLKRAGMKVRAEAAGVGVWPRREPLRPGARAERDFSTKQTPSQARVVSRIVPFIEPERAFAALWRDEPTAFWLDGNGRYSQLGPGGSELVRVRARHIEMRTTIGTTYHDADPFTFLGELLLQCSIDPRTLPPGLGPLAAGYVGYLGYELKEFAGGPAGPRRQDALPDAQLLLADRILVVDRDQHEARLCCLIDGRQSEAQAVAWLDETERRLAEAPDLRPVEPSATVAADASRLASRVPFRLDRGAARYRADVEQIQRLLREGETYEICLTTQLRGPALTHPFDLYRMLRCTNPAPFSAYFRFPDCAVLSASPELFVDIDRDGAVESRPIKGTRRRGGDAAEDQLIAAALATSEKDRAENLMIVDLVRHDLGGVCEAGSVCVPALMAIEAHPTVFQMVSTVRGQLAEGKTATEAVRALFPGGSMTGAPKLRSMSILGELEGAPRGIYSGGLGYFSFDGAVHLAMAIRTIVQCSNEVSFGVGGAVVALSNAEDELAEALLKGRALMRAIRQARGEELVDEEEVV